MQLALRPYVTTGVAVVGATVIAATPIAPITPAEVQIPNPAVQAVQRDVQLTAAEIENAVNSAIYNFVARPTVASAELLGKLLAPIIGEEQAFALPLAALGLSGPLISGGGSVGTALQTIVESDSFEELLNNLIGGVGTIVDGSVNGGYGPDLAPLVKNILIALDPRLGLLPRFPVVLSGGLINEQEVTTVNVGNGTCPGVAPACVPIPVEIKLPGTIPVLQGLIEQLSGLLGGEEMVTASLLSPVEPRPIEDGVNELVYSATALTIRVATLGAPLVAPILGVSNAEAAGFLALGTLGFIGPLINGTNGFGHALQDLVDSDDLADFLDNSLDMVRLPIDGAVNGGFSNNFEPLVRGYLPTIPPVQVNPNPPPNVYLQPTYGTVLAGGFITPPGQTTTVDDDPPSITVDVQLPGTVSTLQGLVTRVFGDEESTNLKVAGAASESAGDDQKVEPKKRDRPLLNLVKSSPLADLSPVGAKHLPGIGKHPVRDLINKVVNGGKDKSGDDENSEDASDAE